MFTFQKKKSIGLKRRVHHFFFVVCKNDRWHNISVAGQQKELWNVAQQQKRL